MTTTVQQLINVKPSKSLHRIDPEATVLEALRMMTELKVGALLVMEGKEMKGVLSERDYARKVVLQSRTSDTTKVGEIMTTKVHAVDPSDTLESCMKLMSENHIRHLPVLKDGKPITVISIMDVLRSILTEKEAIIGQLENYITEAR